MENGQYFAVKVIWVPVSIDSVIDPDAGVKKRKTSDTPSNRMGERFFISLR